MKIILMAMNAKYIHSNLAVYSLQSYAGAKGFCTELKEYTINQQEDEILRDLVREEPDVLAVSVYIWNVGKLCTLLADLANILPDLRIWAGGPEVTFRASEFLISYPFIEGIMRGEGEKTFADLCSVWNGQKNLSEVRGITWKQEENRIIQNPDQDPLDMDELIFPYEDLERFENRILYYESGRGCPFRCSYCLSSVEKNLRFRSWEKVRRELRFFLDRKVPQVKFIDRTFNCNREHTMQIWNYLKEHDNGITNFHFEIGADLLDEEQIHLLSQLRPGFFQLEIGVQTTCTDTLKEIRRYVDFGKLSSTVTAVAASHNIHQHLDLIAGLPYEDYSRFRISFNDVYALRPEQLQLGFLKVLRGSLMYDNAGKYGLCFKKQEPYEVLSTEWLSYQNILDLKLVEEMVEVYYNSGQFSETMQELEKLFPDAFTMYEQLGQFYEENGYIQISHTRMRRYEILLEFLSAQTGLRDYRKQITQAMIRDVYRRENCRNRPQWAEDQSLWKDAVKDFYSKEEENRTILPEYAGYDRKQLRSMTHIEVVAETDSEHRQSVRSVLLFDYRSRDPLNFSARVIDITKFFRQGVNTYEVQKQKTENIYFSDRNSDGDYDGCADDSQRNVLTQA